MVCQARQSAAWGPGPQESHQLPPRQRPDCVLPDGRRPQIGRSLLAQCLPEGYRARRLSGPYPLYDPGLANSGSRRSGLGRHRRMWTAPTCAGGSPRHSEEAQTGRQSRRVGAAGSVGGARPSARDPQNQMGSALRRMKEPSLHATT